MKEIKTTCTNDLPWFAAGPKASWTSNQRTAFRGMYFIFPKEKNRYLPETSHGIRKNILRLREFFQTPL